MENTEFSLTPSQALEVSRYLSEGWSWAALSKLLRRKWDITLSADSLRRAYALAADNRRASAGKNDRRSEAYCAILPE